MEPDMDTVTPHTEQYGIILEEISNESLWSKIEVVKTELARIEEELMQLRCEFSELQKQTFENV